MPNKQICHILTILTALFSTSIFAAIPESPVGYWKTIDDVSGETKSIIEISSLPNHTLEGRVVKLFQHPEKICTECKDSRKNQPILGMVVMQGLHQAHPNDNLWDDGSILDPKNGKIYRCNLQLTDNNQKLLVRGYLGIPLFGRSQTWLKTEKPQS